MLLFLSQNRGIYMFRLDEDRVVDATLSGGLARYINHSCNPNCVAELVAVERDLRIIIFAKRRISRGEEVSIIVAIKSWFKIVRFFTLKILRWQPNYVFCWKCIWGTLSLGVMNSCFDLHYDVHIQTPANLTVPFHQTRVCVRMHAVNHVTAEMVSQVHLC